MWMEDWMTNIFISWIALIAKHVCIRPSFAGWRHQMESFSALLAITGIHRSPVNSPHKGQWRGAWMFSLICAWINGWVNNGEAGDLRRHHAHYDVTLLEREWQHGPKIMMYIDHLVKRNCRSNGINDNESSCWLLFRCLHGKSDIDVIPVSSARSSRLTSLLAPSIHDRVNSKIQMRNGLLAKIKFTES